MKTLHKKLIALPAAATLLLLAACGGAEDSVSTTPATGSLATNPASAQQSDDATITARVRISLAKDEALSGAPISVDTQNGVVTLRGPALTAAARERASEVARGVQGVSSVNNQLTIKAG